MTDEERIAKLQKLLDRVLTRGESDDSAESDDAASGERTQVSGDPPSEPPGAPAAAIERFADPSDHRVVDTKDDDPPIPDALESRSRLVSAQTDAEELSPDDLVPASESSSELEAAAVPLVTRSRRPSIELRRAEEQEPLSEGRTPLSVDDVQIGEEAEKSLAEEIAAEETHSGEIEEEAPISSRRPIDSDGDARAHEGDAPPESGKQVAAAPFEGPTSSARKSASPSSGRVGPDVLRAEMPSSNRLGSIVPPVPPRPATFGELIDLALDL